MQIQVSIVFETAAEALAALAVLGTPPVGTPGETPPAPPVDPNANV